MAKFKGLNAQVLGISVDHVPCLVAWSESLKGINYPLLSDFWPHGAVAQKYGVLRTDGKSERALFIIDREGMIRYKDIHDIDNQPDNEELLAVLRALEPQAAAAAAPEPEPQALPSGGIVMYCTKWCSDCIRARAWLQERGHAFEEVNIYDVPGAKEQVRAWTGGNLTTPTFDINGEIVVDFDVNRLEKLLG